MAKKEQLICPMCHQEVTLSGLKGINIPTTETENSDFQEDRHGNFRIKVGDTHSQWTNTYGIASIEVDGKKYFAVHQNGQYAKIFQHGVILNSPENV